MDDAGNEFADVKAQFAAMFELVAGDVAQIKGDEELGADFANGTLSNG